ncbi:MAG TPA: hypothetical protein VM510_11675 [Caulifigura sp.]|nr:hypothetical protein [Caulifigura sp.]
MPIILGSGTVKVVVQAGWYSGSTFVSFAELHPRCQILLTSWSQNLKEPRPDEPPNDQQMPYAYAPFSRRGFAPPGFNVEVCELDRQTVKTETVVLVDWAVIAPH